MASDTDHPARDAVTVAICCPKCGATGAAVWQDEAWGAYLVSLSGNFYERLAKFRPYKVEIVCHACGARQSQCPPGGG